MTNPPGRDPLHGVTLEVMLNFLVARRGWEEMARQIDIRCFKWEPSVGSSLHFLRRTPWARAKVEQLYLRVRAEEKPNPSAG
ncbi:MAG TPA: VF530 family protein [Opitutaceae bacterium]|nr:VF530 family protein [Opitutaceae bacterium]